MTVSVPIRTFAGPVSCFFKDCCWRLSWGWFFKQCWVLVVFTIGGTLSYLLINHFAFQTIRVDGPSMYPTLTDSRGYWLNRLAYVVDQPKQDDIVVLRDPQDQSPVVKRIIATPGQSVYLKKGKVYVDGQLLREPYIPSGTPTYAYEKSEDELICIGRNEFFVMGDNRNNSMDSRTFGAVPRQNILGKIME